MEEKGISLAGRIFGKWQVLEAGSPTEKGERRWLCRCECGTERPVLERSLKSGGSTNCGCGRRKRISQNNRHDLEGQVFGELTVMGVAQNQRKNGGVWWTCRCSCGETYDVPATLLVTGRRTHCSGETHRKKYAYRDITGQKFGKLTALHPTKNRNRTSVVWHCICDCGQEAEFSLNDLLYGNLKSCGCQKKKHNEELRSHLIHVGGTSVDQLRSKKVPKDNTTGYKGVYFIRGRYTAKIVFQKRHTIWAISTAPRKPQKPAGKRRSCSLTALPLSMNNGRQRLS